VSQADKIEGVAATRMKLLELRSKSKLAQHGHDLLKEKMDALIIEFYNVLNEVKEAQSKTSDVIEKAHEALRLASLSLGSFKLNNLGLNAPSTLSLKTSTRNIMGVKAPKLELKERKLEVPFYDAETTNVAFDGALINFRTTISSVVNLAEKIATMQKLAYEINTTKRRVNALNHIIIPRLNNTAVFIELSLEEDDRETFSRLKFIKNKIELAKMEEQ
jgi:V/A-type H+/Na+-transporting ATPase subunit D